MIIGRFSSDDCKSLRTVYKLADFEGNRLECGITDFSAINALEALIEGGITALTDFEAVEMALRSFIFHDNIKIFSPIVSLQEPDDNAMIPVIGNSNKHLRPKTKIQPSILPLVNPSFVEWIEPNITSLILFQNESQFEHVMQTRAAKAMKREERLAPLNLPKPTFSIGGDESPIEIVTRAPQTFFKDIFPYEQRWMDDYISPIIASGGAIYMGDQIYSESIEEQATQHADQFFNEVSRHWASYNKLLKKRITISLPVFLSIVLDRSKKREDIPNTIVELREEYSQARKQLWGMFDEADYRLDPLQTIELLNSIQHDTDQTLNKVTGKSYQNSKLNIGSRLLSLAKIISGESFLSLSAASDFKDLLEGIPFRSSFRVEAARLLANDIKLLTPSGLIEKHLTQSELDSIMKK